MKKTNGYTQGKFLCKNPEKYKGTFPIFYRSSYELIFCRWMDSSSRVVTWSSESVVIPYIDPLTKNTNGKPKIRRYFVDNTVVMRQNDGSLQKYLIEIKTFSQTQVPVIKRHTKSTMNRQLTYAKNMAKWKAAREWCEKKGDIKFMLITEKELAGLRL